MNKSIHFTGQPTFFQLLKLIPKELVRGCIERSNADHYYKKFNTWHHLVSMLFACYGHCHSLREVVSGIRAFEGRLQSSGINYLPARSTFSKANGRRDSKVFEEIYWALKTYWDRVLQDSRTRSDLIYIIDSTTIKLFQEIFKGSGCSKADGRRKGGLKVHMAVQAEQAVPSIVHISQAACNDVIFTKYLNLPTGSTVIMDRGYRNYQQYNQWTQQQIRWITRTHPNTFYQTVRSLSVPVSQQQGIQRDEIVRLGFPTKRISKVDCRLIAYRASNGKYFEFITNDFQSEAMFIAQLYQKRWRIELLFKRLKQNMPLQYFLGDSQNAIRIQIWCALIADLLIQVVRTQVKRNWAFSNIVSIVRLHLFNYLDLYSFLNNPERCIIQRPPNNNQLKLNLSG
ncbi:MAG: IS4 family transposase [Bacteroidota bacterium]